MIPVESNSLQVTKRGHQRWDFYFHSPFSSLLGSGSKHSTHRRPSIAVIFRFSGLDSAYLVLSIGKVRQPLARVVFAYQWSRRGNLSGLFETISSFRQGRPTFSFLFSFITDDVMEKDSEGFQHSGAEQTNGEKLCDLDYTDNGVRLPESTKNAQHAFARSARDVAQFGMCLAPQKCKVILSYWTWTSMKN